MKQLALNADLKLGSYKNCERCTDPVIFISLGILRTWFVILRRSGVWCGGSVYFPVRLQSSNHLLISEGLRFVRKQDAQIAKIILFFYFSSLFLSGSKNDILGYSQACFSTTYNSSGCKSSFVWGGGVEWLTINGYMIIYSTHPNQKLLRNRASRDTTMK